MAAGCPPGKKKRIKKLREVKDLWFGTGTHKGSSISRSIQKSAGPDVKFFKQFYETEMKTDWDYGNLPSMPQLRRLERKMKKFSKQMAKKPGNFAKWFYLPEEVMKNNPTTAAYFNSVVRAGNFYRGNMDKVTSDLDSIVELVNMSTKQNTLMRRFGITRSKAQKRLATMESEYKKLLKTNPDKANAYYRDFLKDLSYDSELSVLQSLHELMIDPKAISKDKNKAIAEYGPNLVEASRLWHKEMAPELWKILNDGVHDYIKTLEINQSALGIEKPTIENLKEKLLVQNKKGKWELTKQDHYFPTQALDLIPTFNTLTESMWSGEYSKKFKDVNTHINDMAQKISDNLKLDGNVFEKGAESPTRVSKNVLSIIDTYAKGATRFNYSARITRETVQALQDLHKMEGKLRDDHIDFLANYVNDTHGSALGLDMRQSKFGKIARAITSWQFMSKLGFNVRGAARNATQSLQNYIYFGYKGLKEYNRFDKGKTYNKMLAEAMQEHGVFFTNLEELAMPAEFLPSTKMVDGQLVEVAPTRSDKFTHFLEGVAKTSGKPMQWVENNINRSLTFKIAFSKMYNELNSRKDILEKDIVKDKTWDDATITDKINNEIKTRSSRFAANMVKELHYEYSPFAKPKALRTAPGSVLGQFSTYSINFFNYQRKIASEGLDSVLSREWNSEQAWRMYRLGMTYVAIDAMISPLFSTDIGKLVQNDTKDRIKQLYTWFTGTDAERKKTFFGKGPALGTFGGPFVSDLITVGQLTNFMNMRKNQWTEYFAGYQDFAERTKDEKIFEYVRLLNTQLARTVYSTVPKMVNGTGLTTLIGNELGLYGSSSLDLQHKNLFKQARKLSPQFADDYLTPLDERNRRARAYKSVLQGSSPRQDYDPNDLRAILTALERARNEH